MVLPLASISFFFSNVTNGMLLRKAVSLHMGQMARTRLCRGLMLHFNSSLCPTFCPSLKTSQGALPNIKKMLIEEELQLALTGGGCSGISEVKKVATNVQAVVIGDSSGSGGGGFCIPVPSWSIASSSCSGPA